jgi:hypothetical protein
LSELLEVNPTTIGQVIAETRQLLDDRKRKITPTALRFTSIKALHDYLDTATTPNPPQVCALLSDPSLTGMSRQELQQMIDRLSFLQAAQTERRRYRRRGGERLPGARGGIFQQKITDADRILTTILYQRRVCTRQVLADLFQVSPRTIGNALLEARPLLQHDGYISIPARSRFSSATALLASITPPEGRQEHPESPC